jgi:hypothetical protein
VTSRHRVLVAAAGLAVVAHLALLLYFAGTTNVWDDEANSFFLSRLPVGSLLDLMARNHDEDAPLYNLLQHAWLPVAGDHVLLLRLLPLFGWILCLFGVARLAWTLGGARSAAWALLVVSLWPYHWLAPISLRWYSLAAALTIWNLVFLARYLETDGAGRAWLAGGLALTQTLLWYTNYAAPLLGGVQLAILWMRGDRTRLRGLLVAWLATLLLYLPWLATFLREVPLVAGNRFSLGNYAASLYALVAGEFSDPRALGISIPLGLACALGGRLLWTAPAARIPLACAIGFAAAFAVTGVLDPRRLLFATVPLAIAVGLALASERSRLRPWLVRTGTAAAVVALVGTAHHAVGKTGWITYRWLDDVEGMVERARREHPEALLLTNSNSVAFYARDSLGTLLTFALRAYDREEARAWCVYPKLPAAYRERLVEELQRHRELVYVHHSTYADSSSSLAEVLALLEREGFSKTGLEWTSTPITQASLRPYLDLSHMQTYRLTAVVLARAPRSAPP